MTERLRADLYACGLSGLPSELSVGTISYRLVRTFKHDFFAATGLYEPAEDKIPEAGSAPPLVLKVNRRQSFLGIPLNWLGRRLQRHEIRILRQLQDLDQVPKLIGPWEKTGFLYEYIEGCSLDEKPELPDSFFDDLETLLAQIHARNICYVDFNKRGNILAGRDGRPYLIDFQISRYWKRPGRLCRILQREDRYHLLKHKRRLRPDLLSEQERQDSYRRSFWIRLHRAVAGPFRFVRRRLMQWLYHHKILQSDPGMQRSPENDPRRFSRSGKSKKPTQTD